VHKRLCYKRCMRKWMKDRLKRRAKPQATAKEQAKAPEPLQPKYFDNDEKASQVEAVPLPPTHEAPDAAESRAPIAEEIPPAESQQASEGASAAEDSRGPTRRRRRRGGRGGATRRATARVSAATTPPQTATDAAGPTGQSLSVPSAVPLPIPAGASVVAVEPASPDTIAAELRPTAVVPAAPAATKGTVVLAIGLPGSGKSSWFKRHNIRPLSSDLLRELLFDDAEEQRFQDLVFSNLRSMLRARLIARRPMSYIDATNLNPHERHSWIKLARDYAYDVQALFFDVPLEVCMERHARRGRVVPEDAMRKMAAKLKPPTFEEGFSKITVVRVKKKEESEK
jgi:predicted kinase